MILACTLNAHLAGILYLITKLINYWDVVWQWLVGIGEQHVVGNQLHRVEAELLPLLLDLLCIYQVLLGASQMGEAAKLPVKRTLTVTATLSWSCGHKALRASPEALMKCLTCYVKNRQKINKFNPVHFQSSFFNHVSTAQFIDASFRWRNWPLISFTFRAP